MALELEPKWSGAEWKSGTPVSCGLSVTDADSRVEAEHEKAGAMAGKPLLGSVLNLKLL